jgi:hypothetical protein
MKRRWRQQCLPVVPHVGIREKAPPPFAFAPRAGNIRGMIRPKTVRDKRTFRTQVRYRRKPPSSLPAASVPAGAILPIPYPSAGVKGSSVSSFPLASTCPERGPKATHQAPDNT